MNLLARLLSKSGDLLLTAASVILIGLATWFSLR
jgi:hypothetical protein